MAIVSTHGINSLPHGAPQPYFPDDRYPDGVMTFTESSKYYSYVMMDRNLDYKWPELYIETYKYSYPNDVASKDYPAACYFNFDEDTYGMNGRDYGLFYNIKAIEYMIDHQEIFGPQDSRGASYSWHIPLQSEINTFLYGCTTQNNSAAVRSTEYWENPGTNSAGTNLKPAGWAQFSGFADEGYSACFPYHYKYSGTRYYGQFQFFSEVGVQMQSSNWSPSSSTQVLMNIRLIKHI